MSHRDSDIRICKPLKPFALPFTLEFLTQLIILPRLIMCQIVCTFFQLDKATLRALEMLVERRDTIVKFDAVMKTFLFCRNHLKWNLIKKYSFRRLWLENIKCWNSNDCLLLPLEWEKTLFSAFQTIMRSCQFNERLFYCTQLNQTVVRAHPHKYGVQMREFSNFVIVNKQNQKINECLMTRLSIALNLIPWYFVWYSENQGKRWNVAVSPFRVIKILNHSFVFISMRLQVSVQNDDNDRDSGSGVQVRYLVLIRVQIRANEPMNE